MAVTGSAKRRAHRAARSDTMQAVARAGLAAHGVIWLLLGFLALVMAFSGRSQETDQRGALEELVQHTGGWLLLLVITIGLAGYALWRLVEVLVGPDAKERVKSAVRCIIYGGFAISGMTILAEGHAQSQSKTQQSWTARIMQHDGGRWAVGIAGVVVLGVGVMLAYEGITKKFEQGLDTSGLARGGRRTIEILGVVGSTARGIVVGLVGVLMIVAAVNYDPKKASGVDGALRTVRDAPAGPTLLVVVAIGLIMFGIFGCYEAKYRRV